MNTKTKSNSDKVTKTNQVPAKVEVAPVGRTTVAKRKHRPRTPNVKVLLDTDDLVKEQVGGFVNFVREHAIVGLAIGFVVGTQAQTVVKQLVASFIDPSVQLIFGGTTLSDRQTMLHFGSHHASFLWGAMVYALINLFFVLATVYAVIKIFNLDKLDKPKA